MRVVTHVLVILIVRRWRIVWYSEGIVRAVLGWGFLNIVRFLNCIRLLRTNRGIISLIHAGLGGSRAMWDYFTSPLPKRSLPLVCVLSFCYSPLHRPRSKWINSQRSCKLNTRRYVLLRERTFCTSAIGSLAVNLYLRGRSSRFALSKGGYFATLLPRL